MDPKRKISHKGTKAQNRNSRERTQRTQKDTADRPRRRPSAMAGRTSASSVEPQRMNTNEKSHTKARRHKAGIAAKRHKKLKKWRGAGNGTEDTKDTEKLHPQIKAD